MKDNIKLLAQCILLIVGPLLAKHGYSVDASGLETAIGAMVTIAGMIWKFTHWNSTPDQPAGSKPISRIVMILCLTAFLAGCSFGCSSFTSSQRRTEADGTITESKQKIRTFFDAKTEVAKLRASTTDKTQGLTVGSISTESSGSNVVSLTEASFRGLGEGFAKGLNPIAK